MVCRRGRLPFGMFPDKRIFSFWRSRIEQRTRGRLSLGVRGRSKCRFVVQLPEAPLLVLDKLVVDLEAGQFFVEVDLEMIEIGFG